MSTEMVVDIDIDNELSTYTAEDAVFDELSKGSSQRLKRLRLYSKGLLIDRGAITPGTYGIPKSKDEIDTVIGPQCDVIPFARRPQAMDFTGETPIVSYDFTSETFQDIKDRAGNDDNCSVGFCILCYERTTGEWLEFYVTSDSAKAEVKAIFPYLPLSAAQIERRAQAGHDVTGLEPHGARAVTLSARLIESKRGFSWHVPQVSPCSVPFTNGPTPAQITEEVTRFLKAKGSGEIVAEDGNDSERVR